MGGGKTWVSSSPTSTPTPSKARKTSPGAEQKGRGLDAVMHLGPRPFLLLLPHTSRSTSVDSSDASYISGTVAAHAATGKRCNIRHAHLINRTRIRDD